MSFGFCSNLYWVNSGSSNWASTANWSLTSGGAGGDGIPGSGDVAVFDGAMLVSSPGVYCIGNCTIDAVVNVSGLSTLAGYSGAIAQNSFAITIGVSGGSFAGGIFTGGNANINMNGNFSISGCAFTSTSGILFDISGASINLSSGTFSHNNGTIIFSSSSNTITGNFTFYNLTFSNSSGSTNTASIGAGNTLIVLNTLAIAGSSPLNINSGTIEARGDITLSNSATTGGGTTALLINGAANQTLTGQGTSGQGLLLPLTINKTAGNLVLSGIITTSNNFTYTAGSISYGTSKMVFTGSPTIGGNFPQLYDIEFLGPATVAIVVGSTPVINGSLSITGSSAVTLNGGVLNVYGNILLANTAYGGGGSATISVKGTGVRNLTGSGVAGQGALPVVNIVCTGGTLNLVGTITSSGNWLYTSGTLNPGTSRMVFTGSLGLFGNHTLNEIEIFGNTNGSVYVQPGNTVTVSNNLYFTGTSPMTFTSGIISAKSDILVTNTGLNGSGGGTILISGTGAQNLSSTSTALQSRLPNITVSKPSGTLTITGLISVTGDWTYVQGTVDAGISTVTLYNARNITGKGGAVTMDFYNLTLGDVNRRTMLSDMSVTNTLVLGSGNFDLGGNTCFIRRSAAAAVTSSSGFFLSERTSNASKLSWNLSATVGSYVFPFGTAAASLIPFTFQLTAGDAGYVTVSTYPTASDNTPLPITPDAVTTVITASGSSGNSVIDRFWQIDKSGAAATATLTYTYASAEVTGNVTGNESQLRAQRYNTALNKWDNAISGQTVNVGTRKVTEPGVTLFSPRTLALSSDPLPVTLTSFDAWCGNQNTATIKWITGSETNNDFFTIERADSNFVFKSLAKVKGGGTLENGHTYFYEDLNVLTGLYYYRLKQTDYNGIEHQYNNITARCLSKETELVVYPNPGSGKFVIEGLQPGWMIGLHNVLGEEIFSFKSEHFHSELDLTHYANGMYFIRINNGKRTITKKILIRSL